MDGYDPSRGATVVAYANNFLDQFLPLDSISHSNVTAYSIENGLLIAHTDNNQDHQLSTPSQLRGFQGQPESPSVVLLKNNHLSY